MLTAIADLLAAFFAAAGLVCLVQGSRYGTSKTYLAGSIGLFGLAWLCGHLGGI
jgi:hypothetical protein